jgi:hypothetical protein
MRSLALVLVLTLAGPTCASAQSQSLAAVAEKEEARRSRVKKASRIYTNEDVKSDRRPEMPSPGGAADTSTAGQAPSSEPSEPSGEQPADPAAGDEKAPTEEEQRDQDEQQWRARITDARTALERNQILVEALQSRVNALLADFTARDDPAQRAVIDADRKKALAQLDRVKAEIVAQTKAIADIEEEARRAGVPPGWLR